MNVTISTIIKRQKHLKKKTARAVNIIFESDFSKNAYNRVVELTRKYNPEISSSPQRKFHIRLKKDPKRIIAWAVAQRVREARERLGLTQDALAEKTGIARPNIVRLEQGRHIPTLTTIKKIADALGLDINTLMTQPTVTEEDRLEFKEMAESGIDDWGKRLNGEDVKY